MEKLSIALEHTIDFLFKSDRISINDNLHTGHPSLKNEKTNVRVHEKMCNHKRAIRYFS
jgi:hypothetical protein